MSWFVALVLVLVALGSVLAMAETSISRMSRVRAMALREEGRRNAAILERIEEDPARHLNSIYFSVMVVQNGSAILVAILADRAFGSVGITLLSAGFTLVYFLVVEAMSKTFGILHSDRVALALAPVVRTLARLLASPTRFLIGIANWLLPGKGLKQGPFVSEEEIRSMAEVGHAEGMIEEEEKEMIHSIFEFGDTVVREVMVPRPDMVAVEGDMPLREALGVMLTRGFSRVPVYEESMDNVTGVIYAKDVMRRLHDGGRRGGKVAEIARAAVFVPESKKVAELLREMQASKTHMAIVVDEFGDVSGLVTMEDLLEEIVGEIADEYDREEPQVQPLDERTVRVAGRLPIDELSEILEVELPATEWDTVGGLVSGLLGKVPRQGDEVCYEGLTFRAERVQGRRIAKVLITRTNQDGRLAGP
ncbi:MAG: HlyC/CorC family transporter [Acidobacteria bacterium]|nr:HlyC/CorC family transporter [Acidobacteriota bacterium]